MQTDTDGTVHTGISEDTTVHGTTEAFTILGITEGITTHGITEVRTMEDGMTHGTTEDGMTHGITEDMAIVDGTTRSMVTCTLITAAGMELGTHIIITTIIIT